MENKTLSSIEITKIKKELISIEMQRRCFEACDSWQPYRYTIFIEKIEKIIETLKNILIEISMYEKEIEKETIEKHAIRLLREYLELWEMDFK